MNNTIVPYEFEFEYEIENDPDEEITLVAGVVKFPDLEPEATGDRVFMRRVVVIDQLNPSDHQLQRARYVLAQTIAEDIFKAATGLGNLVGYLENTVLPSVKPSDITGPHGKS